MPRLISFVSLCAFLLASLCGAAAEPISFNQSIRPILSDRCFNCHGPDDKGRKSKLRLDTPDGSRKRLEDGWQVIKPGDVDHSELVRRVFSEDPDEVMPPPESNLKLTRAEKELLKQWIAEGGAYEGHWSFIPLPNSIPVPASSFENPIDAFVNRELDRKNLRLSPEATRATLIRRLSFDLTGLPPTPAEIEIFLNDQRPDAYERLVDRLLASPHYGEQRAVDWLDLARYADTYGYQADVERDMSPWRDWVIRAFNENLPYDDFLTWQIAGDLLPDATRDQILSTAFNRLHRQTNEGGSIDEEFRVEYVSDRVHTFGTAVLGLTMECSRCHDHKYDPIKQRDYYAVSAFFNNIDESGLYSHFTRATPNPTLLLYENDQQETRHAELKRELATLQAKADRWPTADRIAIPSTTGLIGTNTWEGPKPVAAFAFDELAERRSPNLISTNAAVFEDLPGLVPGQSGRAVEFSGDNEVVCKGTGEFSRADAFSISLRLQRAIEQDRAVVLHFSRAWSDSGSRGYELVLDHGRPFFGLIHFWPGNAIAVRGVDPIPLNEWVNVTLTYDGSSRAEGLGIYVNGVRAQTEIVRDHLFKDILHRGEWGDADVGNINLTLGGRFRDSGFQHGKIDDLLVFDSDLTRNAMANDPEGAALLVELAALRHEENNLVNDVPEIMVMREMAERRPTFRLNRGAYDMRAEPVEPDTLPGIFPFDPALPKNRLGLAGWVVDRRNPLTARVAVNRAWKQHFGRGLVSTLEDFGSQGSLPSHPALLDWLAVWFTDNHWDVKALHRLIATSRTYRQTSRVSAELAAADPSNEWLARGPRHRLSAEQIRDEALAVSGLLVPVIGGPSVKPYQPAGLWEESGTGKTYQQDKGDKLYRRSLYTFWRRTAPPPSMITFDATSREVCTAKRETPSTPLQSLVLLNDPQFLEAARVLADELVTKSGEQPREMVREAFLRLISREPTAEELGLLERLYLAQSWFYAGHPDLTGQLLSIGETPAPTNHPEETAAMAMVINTLMNYDEFIVTQ